MLPSSELVLKVEECLKPFRLENGDLKKVMEKMEDDAVKGLSSKQNIDANLKMYITYVKSLPDGTEVGSFLALDLGGTNFRVLMIDLNDVEAPIQSQKYMIPESIMIGSGEQLFDHIASCIQSFLIVRGIENEALPLGFTFSFPCKQEGLDKSLLVQWTKGFKCSGVEGEDIVKLLHKSTEKKGLKVRCVAVINDAVGTMMSCAHRYSDCSVAVILGTGTNACYLENIDNVESWDSREEADKMVINTEWGAFGERGELDFILTKYDVCLDKISKNPSKQTYEKLISGMYLGEIARQIIVDLIRQEVLFQGMITPKIFTPFNFLTKYISEIDGESEFSSFCGTRQILEDLEITNYSSTDCLILRSVCHAVSLRSAQLAAAGVAVLIKRVGKQHTTVGIDGSLYKFHPSFHKIMDLTIKQLLPENQFNLRLSNDGSGIGAAIVAAVATRS